MINRKGFIGWLASGLGGMVIGYSGKRVRSAPASGPPRFSLVSQTDTPAGAGVLSTRDGPAPLHDLPPGHYSLVPGDYHIEQDTAVPPGVSLHVPYGAVFHIAEGVTLRAGHVTAGLYRIFDGHGAVVLAGAMGGVPPQWWGARADASDTDNSEAMRSWGRCIDRSGVDGWIPGGRYHFSTGIRLTSRGARIRGAGKRRSYFVFTGTSGAAITLSGDSSSIEHMTLVGPGSESGDAVGIRILDASGNGPKDVALSGVELLRFPVGVHDRGFAVKLYALRFENCGDCIQTANQGGHSSVIGLWMNDSRVGVRFVGDVTHWAMHDSNLERCDVGLLAGGRAAAPKTMAIYNCHFEGNARRDVDLGQGVEDFAAEACRFGGLNSHSAQSIRHTGAVQAKETYRVRLRGCRFIDDGEFANSEVIYLGPRVRLILDAPPGEIPGCPRSAITLARSAPANLPRIIAPG